MHSKHKKKLIITLQLKNAEVYPGSNLHGTVILQLMHKHNHNAHRYRTGSVESMSVDLTPKLESFTFNKSVGSLTVIDRVSISVTGICNINESVTEREHFPSHLKLENEHFNILSGKENILGHALQFGQMHNESIQFDFVVQLPPVLPCSYCGYFIQYLYYAQLFVKITNTKHHHEATKCRVPFYVLPAKHDPYNHDIPRLLTPKNLQERMSIFRMRKKTLYNAHNASSSSSSSSSSASHYSSPPSIGTKIGNKPSPSLLLPPANRAHFVENDLLSTTNKMLEEKNNISSYLNSNALYLNYRDSNEINDTDEFEMHHKDIGDANNKFRISLDHKEIGILLLNDTIFGDGQCIEGHLSLSTPCIVRVTLVHCEECGSKQKHFTNCSSHYQCSWFLPSFSFNLKIPNNAFKSFQSDLCRSSWSLNFQFAISKHLLINKQLISSTNKNNTLYVSSPQTDIWKIYEMDHRKLHKKENSNGVKANHPQIDKILNWNLPITVTTMHNPLRCVTRSNAVIVKC